VVKIALVEQAGGGHGGGGGMLLSPGGDEATVGDGCRVESPVSWSRHRGLVKPF
jgi:hypothetical protein